MFKSECTENAKNKILGASIAEQESTSTGLIHLALLKDARVSRKKVKVFESLKNAERNKKKIINCKVSCS